MATNLRISRDGASGLMVFLFAVALFLISREFNDVVFWISTVVACILHWIGQRLIARKRYFARIESINRDGVVRVRQFPLGILCEVKNRPVGCMIDQPQITDRLNEFRRTGENVVVVESSRPLHFGNRLGGGYFNRRIPEALIYRLIELPKCGHIPAGERQSAEIVSVDSQSPTSIFEREQHQ